MPAPAHPKIYHIVHVDKLASIVGDGALLSDAEVLAQGRPGTTIGMTGIKWRRMNQYRLQSHPDLFVGQCVPFYFCPRSVMLYLIHQANHPEMTYRGGQGPIVTLECDMQDAIAWAEENDRRWAFTLSNAGSSYFEDRCELEALNEIDWAAVAADRWSGTGVSRQVKEGKQAEFLVEQTFPWHLVERIGVRSNHIAQQVGAAMQGAAHRPVVEIRTSWYY